MAFATNKARPFVGVAPLSFRMGLFTADDSRGAGLAGGTGLVTRVGTGLAASLRGAGARGGTAAAFCALPF